MNCPGSFDEEMIMSKAKETLSEIPDWRQDPIHETELANLQRLAGEAWIDLDAASEQLFRVPAEQLTTG